jgi:hypothetical protein
MTTPTQPTSRTDDPVVQAVPDLRVEPRIPRPRTAADAVAPVPSDHLVVVKVSWVRRHAPVVATAAAAVLVGAGVVTGFAVAGGGTSQDAGFNDTTVLASSIQASANAQARAQHQLAAVTGIQCAGTATPHHFLCSLQWSTGEASTLMATVTADGRDWVTVQGARSA